MKINTKFWCHKILVALAIVSFLVSNCKKEELPTRWELLTLSFWTMTSSTAFDLVPDEDYCIISFDKDGSFKSNSFSPNSGSWSLIKNDSILVIGGYEFQILILTETILEIKIRLHDFCGTGSLECLFSFKPLPIVQANTVGVSHLSKTSVTLHGTVRTTDFSTKVTFEYGTSLEFGHTKSVNELVFPGITPCSVSVSLSELLPGQVYYYRIKAVDSSIKFYGQDLTFKTFNSLTVSDIDGNTYNTITIGKQIWMAENLKTTRFNDNVSILLVIDSVEWANLATPGYCWYNNNENKYKDSYGGYYNWYAVNTGKLCPTGWHVPTDIEWHQLIFYLDSGAVWDGAESYVASDKLKEASSLHWESPNSGTNESGFSALPGAYRFGTGYGHGSFYYQRSLMISSFGAWWTATEHNSLYSWHRSLNTFTPAAVYRSYDHKTYGLTVRCIMD